MPKNKKKNYKTVEPADFEELMMSKNTMLVLKNYETNEEIIKFSSLYELADNKKLLLELLGENQLAAIQQFLKMNAFTICIKGAKLRFDKYVIEQVEENK